MEIKKVTDAAFKKYGKVVQGIDFGPLVEALASTPLPEGVDYLPSVAELEATPTFAELQTKSFGELPTQIGYCNGHNYKLNALEYHRSSEINVGGTDAILLVGLQSDITEDFTYDTSLVEAFFLPKGTAVELAIPLSSLNAASGSEILLNAVLRGPGLNDGFTRASETNPASWMKIRLQ